MESPTKYKERYNQKQYSSIRLRVYQGEEEKLRKYCAENGETVNGFINRLISEKIDDFRPMDTEKQKGRK